MKKKVIPVVIDPMYISASPWHLVPALLAEINFPPKKLWQNWHPSPSRFYTRNKYGKGLFDGMEFDLAYSPLLDPQFNIREPMIERYSNFNWPILAYHAAYKSMMPTKSLNFCDGTDLDRKGLKNQLVVVNELSKGRSKESIVVVHLGSTSDRVKGLDSAIQVIGSVLPFAEENNIKIAIENMTASSDNLHHLGADYREILRVIETLRSPAVGVCFDWGHANNFATEYLRLTSRGYDEAYVQSFGYASEMIDALADKIIYAHIHYNQSHLQGDVTLDRHNDQHMSLNRIPKSEMPQFSESIKVLLNKCNCSAFNLELFPKKFFKFVPFSRTGSDLTDQFESLKILRTIMSTC